jgi:hypothetical protein
MAVKVIIPGRTHEEFGFSISKLIGVLDNISLSIKEGVQLDFRNATMLNPFFLGGLTCVIDYYQSIGVEIESNHETNLSVASYLKTVQFPSTFEPVGDDWSLNEFYHKTYIPIIRFPTGESKQNELVRNRILQAISDPIKLQLGFTERQRGPLSYLMDELTHNINDHSGAKEGFVFAQYYPASNFLDLCICDHGKGIYQSYIDTGKHNPKNEIESIRLAISGFSTKDRAESKGFGITTSKRMLTAGLRGKFFLWSGNTAYIESVERVSIIKIPKNCYFQGTYIALRIPTITPPEFNLNQYLE